MGYKSVMGGGGMQIISRHFLLQGLLINMFFIFIFIYIFFFGGGVPFVIQNTAAYFDVIYIFFITLYVAPI